MSTSVDQIDGNTLRDTLELALTQCQDQIRLVSEQSQNINDLRQENKQLKQELEALKAQPQIDLKAHYAAQYQQVFQLVAAREAEIDRLKDKLRRAKIKAQRQGLNDLIISSPAVQPSHPQSASSKAPTFLLPPLPRKNKKAGSEHNTNVPALRSTQSASPPRKRPRSLGTSGQPLQRVPDNLETAAPKLTRVEKTRATRQPTISNSVIAIPELTEDGEDHMWKKRKSMGEQKSKMIQESAYHRLDNLLDSHAPSGPMLLRTQSSSPPSTKHAPLDASQVDPSFAPSGPHILSPGEQLEKPASSLKISNRNEAPDSEDNEPFRSRPIHRLNLQHFKINPASNSGLDYAFNQVIRGRDRKCLPGCTKDCCVGAFRALADTLPGSSTLDGRYISDQELLLDYLGSGSEERIKNLTPKARENLVHDARTKYVANVYGKMHRDLHERGRSPPGFWRVDMPGSQEHNDDREQAKLGEREQVLQRYNDAMKGGGRWMFADE